MKGSLFEVNYEEKRKKKDLFHNNLIWEQRVKKNLIFDLYLCTHAHAQTRARIRTHFLIRIGSGG